MGGTSKFLLLFLHFIHTLSLFHFPSLFLTFLRFFSSGTQVEREEKVSLELSEEILQSMEVGMSFKDYVSNIYDSVFAFVFYCLIKLKIRVFLFCNWVYCSLILLQNGRISSMDFHKTSSYLVTASDDESIRLYDVAAGT
jgi:COMPASS component SWD2